MNHDEIEKEVFRALDLMVERTEVTHHGCLPVQIVAAAARRWLIRVQPAAWITEGDASEQD